MLTFDHLAVTSATLAEGVEAVEAALGVALAGGGQHPHMATHNRLLGLGELYLEVIAVDPDAPTPLWPRWFDMDRFSGPARLTNWVAACEDIEAELALSPAGVGEPVALQRGDYRWQMAIPADGCLPFDGGFPALIAWEGALHPARALPDAGVRLTRLEIAHPGADALADALATRIADPRVVIVQGPRKAMRATFSTPHGARVLT
ncbi:VOC family protein [Tabrizicola sp.]|uniref:VOC family protein n=1 Tax=Tabrizicola sp. TaxID=2005166 RepID=UPI00286B66D5|nr:VOC family protein [Tabrizicola sp.]